MSEALPAPEAPAPEDRVQQALEALAARMAEIEDAVAEVAEEVGKLRKAVAGLSESVATRKQVKKLKKALDQLEVIELGPDGTPGEDRK